MQARSTVPFRHGARAMCSTLPARRSDRSRFALAAKRMYRLCSNASRVLHRVFVGRFCTRYRIYPSDRHGCAVSEAAVDGTRGWTAFGHLERPKVRLILPLNYGHKHVISLRGATGKNAFSGRPLRQKLT